MDFEITSALTALKTGIALAAGALEARDDQKVKAALGEIAARLADAQMDALGMSETLRKLEAELRDTASKLAAAEKRLAEREKYVLRAVSQGVFAYAYQPVADDPTPAHYQCQICFDRGESSILQAPSGSGFWYCNRDRNHSLDVSVDRGEGWPVGPDRSRDWGAF